MAEDAILASEREFRARLVVDWNNNGLFDHPLSNLAPYAESVSTDRNLAGSIPAEVLLIEGAASAEMTVILHGEYNGMSLASLFSPYNTASPLYGSQFVGADAQYELGVVTPLGTMWYPQFAGTVRTISPSRSDGTVEIGFLDYAESMRKPIRFPGWATAGTDVTDLTASGQHFGLLGVINKLSQMTDTSWVIDHCLRHCDTSPTPWRPTYKSEFSSDPDSNEMTQVWISGTGSHLPTVGWSSRSNEAEYAVIEGTGFSMYERNNAPHPDSPEPLNRPFNSASLGDIFGDFRCNSVDMVKIPVRGTHYVSFTLILTGQNSTHWQTEPDIRFAAVYIGGLSSIEVQVDQGELVAYFLPNNIFGEPEPGLVSSSRLTIPTDRDSVRVTAVVNTNPGFSGVTCNLICDELSTGVHTIYSGDWWPPGALDLDEIQGFVILEPEVGYADFSYVARASGSSMTVPGISAGSPAKHAAVLDPGLQQLSHMPTRLGDDAWSIVTEVAAAENGAVFWDEDGVFHFWNYQTVLDKRVNVVRSYTLDHFQGLTFTNSLDSVRNIWSIEAGKSVARLGAIFESRNINEFLVEPNTEKWFLLWNDSAIGHIQFDLDHVSGEIFLSGELKPWLGQTRHAFAVTFLDGTHSDGKDRWVENNTLANNVRARAHLDEEGRIVLIVTNDTTEFMRFASTTIKWTDDTETVEDVGSVEAQPTLFIGGSFVDSLDNIVVTLETDASRASVQRFGSRNLKVSGDWVQDSYSLTVAGDVLMPSMLTPTPATDDIVVPGDPRVQLGDTVSVNDRYGFGEDIQLQILGIRREFVASSGLTDTLKVELVNPPAISDTPVVIIADPDGSFDPPA